MLDILLNWFADIFMGVENSRDSNSQVSPTDSSLTLWERIKYVCRHVFTGKGYETYSWYNYIYFLTGFPLWDKEWNQYEASKKVRAWLGYFILFKFLFVPFWNAVKLITEFPLQLIEELLLHIGVKLSDRPGDNKISPEKLFLCGIFFPFIVYSYSLIKIARLLIRTVTSPGSSFNAAKRVREKHKILGTILAGTSIIFSTASWIMLAILSSAAYVMALGAVGGAVTFMPKVVEAVSKVPVIHTLISAGAAAMTPILKSLAIPVWDTTICLALWVINGGVLRATIRVGSSLIAGVVKGAKAVINMIRIGLYEKPSIEMVPLTGSNDSDKVKVKVQEPFSPWTMKTRDGDDLPLFGFPGKKEEQSTLRRRKKESEMEDIEPLLGLPVEETMGRCSSLKPD